MHSHRVAKSVNREQGDKALKRILPFALLLAVGLWASGQIPNDAPWTAKYRAQQVEELRRESRLPGWANYVCGIDQIGVHGGPLMLIAYQQNGYISGEGYKRGLTYQEYIISEKDTDIRTINMPQSPEQYAQDVAAAARANAAGDTKDVPFSHGSSVLLKAELVALQNLIYRAKRASKWGLLSPDDLKNEEIQAFLDAPDGTNYRNFINKHPDAFQYWLAEQKYVNSGLIAKQVKVYREGNVIYESGQPGFGKFETSAGSKGIMDIQIEMTSTPSGLRFTQSYLSGIGMTTSGACDPIVPEK
jgi:hypothetical protein